MKTLLTLLIAVLIGCAAPKPVEAVSEQNGPVLAEETCKKTEKPIIVAVIDTGFGKGVKSDTKLCKFGHKDFTPTQELTDMFGTKDKVPLDKHGHGTNIVGVIEKYAGDANYCIVVLKYFDPNHNNSLASARAFQYAMNLKVQIINYSGGGTEKSDAEKALVKKFIDNGGKIIAAAGNEKSDIDEKKSYYYPALSDPRVVVVGNATKFDQQSYDESKDENKEKKQVYVDGVLSFVSPVSNWGFRVNYWEYGENVSGHGITMTGTSQATAIHTGKFIKKLGCQK